MRLEVSISEVEGIPSFCWAALRTNLEAVNRSTLKVRHHYLRSSTGTSQTGQSDSATVSHLDHDLTFDGRDGQLTWIRLVGRYHCLLSLDAPADTARHHPRRENAGSPLAGAEPLSASRGACGGTPCTRPGDGIIILDVYKKNGSCGCEIDGCVSRRPGRVDPFPLPRALT